MDSSASTGVSLDQWKRPGRIRFSCSCINTEMHESEEDKSSTTTEAKEEPSSGNFILCRSMRLYDRSRAHKMLLGFLKVVRDQ